MSSNIEQFKPDDIEIPTGVCVNCHCLRTRDGWLDRIASDEEFKNLGRIICPNCGPKK